VWLPIKCKFTKECGEGAYANIILTYVSDTFCKIVREEREVLDTFKSLGEVDGVVFKRLPGKGRETCDVCQTTIFNYHWVCPLCGYLVCIDCWNEDQAQRGGGNFFSLILP
jgi:lysine-specific demethylase 3